GAATAPPARGPPATAQELAAAVAEREARIAGLPADRWTAEQLPRRDALVKRLHRVVQRLGRVGATSPHRAELLAHGAGLLAALDVHVATAAKAGWKADWRGGISPSHRRLYVPITFAATGQLLFGMYSMALFGGAHHVAELVPDGVLLTGALFGQVVGMLAVGPLWDKLSARLLTVTSLVGTAAALGLFGVAGDWVPGYYLAAALAGVAGSGNFYVLANLQESIGRTTELRRAHGEKPRLSDGVIGLSILGVVTTLSAMLTISELLEPISLHLALGVAAAVTVALAVAAFLVTPAERFDRAAAPSLAQLFIRPFSTVLHNRFALAVAAVYGTYAFTLGAIDSVWRFFFATVGAPGWLTITAGWAFVGGGVLLAGLFVRGDLGRGAGLLQTRPREFVVSAAALMAAGGLVVALTQHLGLNPAIGAVVGLYMLEVTSTGKLLGLNVVIKQTDRLAASEKQATKTAGGLVKAVMQVLGSFAATTSWASGGWDLVSALVALGGVLTFAAATTVDPRWLTGFPSRLRAVAAWVGAHRSVRIGLAVAVGVLAVLGLGGDAHATGGGGGGLVATHDAATARTAMQTRAETLYQASAPLRRWRNPHLPRGPPGVRVRVVPAALRPAGAEGVLAFGYQPRGVVLVFDDVLAGIGALIAAGRLPAHWWRQLLVHERDFHLAGTEHTGDRHDRDADRLAEQFVAAGPAPPTGVTRGWVAGQLRLGGSAHAAPVGAVAVGASGGVRIGDEVWIALAASSVFVTGLLAIVLRPRSGSAAADSAQGAGTGQPTGWRVGRTARRWAAGVAAVVLLGGVRGSAPVVIDYLPAPDPAVVRAEEAERRELAAEFTDRGFVSRGAVAGRGEVLALPDARGDELLIGVARDPVMSLLDELRALTFSRDLPTDGLSAPRALGTSADPWQIVRAWRNRPELPYARAGALEQYLVSYELLAGSKTTVALLVVRTELGAWLVQSQRVTAAYAAAAAGAVGAGPQTAGDLVERVARAVVRLRLAGGRSLGSGVLVDPSGTVLTAGHVVDGARRRGEAIVAEMWDGRTVGTRVLDMPDADAVQRRIERVHGPGALSGPLSYSGADRVDLAALRLTLVHDRGPLPSLPVARTRPALGEPVFTVAYPGATDTTQYLTVVGGPVAPFRAFGENDRPDLKDLGFLGWSYGGASGGAVVNSRGELVGLLTGGLLDEAGVTSVHSQGGPEITAVVVDMLRQQRRRQPGSGRRVPGHGASGAGSGSPTGGPLAVLYTPDEVDLVGRALAVLAEGSAARWAGDPVSARGPPELGLRPHERLLEVDVPALASAAGIDPVRAEDLLARMVAFGVRHGDVHVIAVPVGRVDDLLGARAWADVLDHERRFHLDPDAVHDDAAHTTAAADVLLRIAAEQGRHAERVARLLLQPEQFGPDTADVDRWLVWRSLGLGQAVGLRREVWEIVSDTALLDEALAGPAGRLVPADRRAELVDWARRARVDGEFLRDAQRALERAASWPRSTPGLLDDLRGLLVRLDALPDGDFARSDLRRMLLVEIAELSVRPTPELPADHLLFAAAPPAWLTDPTALPAPDGPPVALDHLAAQVAGALRDGAPERLREVLEQVWSPVEAVRDALMGELSTGERHRLPETRLDEVAHALDLLGKLPGWGVAVPAGLPDSVAAKVSALRETAVIGRIADARSAGLSVPRYWRAVFGELGALAAEPPRRPSRLRSTALRVLLEQLDVPLDQEADWDWLRQRPEWLDRALGSPRWLRGAWRQAARREQLALVLAVAATGAPSWMTLLPHRARSYPYLDALVRYHISWQTEDVRPAVAEVIAAMPAEGWRSERPGFVGAWAGLVREIVRAFQLDGRVVPAEVRAIAADLAGTVAGTGFGKAVTAEVDAAAARVRAATDRAWFDRVGLAGQPMAAGSDAMTVLVGHHRHSGAVFSRLIAVYAAVKGGVPGRRAFERAWKALLRGRDGRMPTIARAHVPVDLPRRVPGPRGDLDVLIGVSRDPLEILELGYPDLGSSCLDCVYGVMRQHAQQYVLHPAVVVLYAWQALPDGTRGARLARIAVARTDAGLLLLGKRVQTDLQLVDFGPAFRDYLGRWAARVGLPVLSVGESYRQLGIERSDLTRSSRTVRLPAAPSVGVHEFYADGLQGYRAVRLPFTVTTDLLWEWRPEGAVGALSTSPLSTEHRQALHDALVRLRAAGGVAVGSPQGRGPPEADEVLFTPTAASAARELRAGGMPAAEASALVDRVLAVSWRDGSVAVITVWAERLPELSASGGWELVLAHERGLHLDAAPDGTRTGHDEHAREVLDVLAVLGYPATPPSPVAPAAVAPRSALGLLGPSVLLSTALAAPTIAELLGAPIAVQAAGRWLLIGLAAWGLLRWVAEPQRAAPTVPAPRPAHLIAAELVARPLGAATVAELAEVLRIGPADVVAAVRGSSLLLLAGPGEPAGEQLVLLGRGRAEAAARTAPAADVDLVRVEDGARHRLAHDSTVIGSHPRGAVRTAGDGLGVLEHRASGWHLVAGAVGAPARVAGRPAAAVLPVAVGDEVVVGGERFRLERAGPPVADASAPPMTTAPEQAPEPSFVPTAFQLLVGGAPLLVVALLAGHLPPVASLLAGVGALLPVVALVVRTRLTHRLPLLAIATANLLVPLWMALTGRLPLPEVVTGALGVAVQLGWPFAAAYRALRYRGPPADPAPPREEGDGPAPPGRAPPRALAAPVVLADPSLPQWLLDGVAAAARPVVLVGAALGVLAVVVRTGAVRRLEDVHDRVEDLLDRIDDDRDRVLRGAAPAELGGVARALDQVAAALRSPLLAAAPRRQRHDERDSVALARARLTAVRAAHVFLRQARGAASRSEVRPGRAAAVHALDGVPDPVDWTRRLRARVDRAFAGLPAGLGRATAAERRAPAPQRPAAVADRVPARSWWRLLIVSGVVTAVAVIALIATGKDARADPPGRSPPAAVVVAPAAVGSPAPAHRVVVTQRGDTYSGLRRLLGLPAAAFGGRDGRIRPGTALAIPDGEFRDGRVEVRPGDSLDYYRRLFDLPDYRAITALDPRRFGPGSDPDLIRVGERLRVVPALPRAPARPHPADPDPGAPTAPPGTPGVPGTPSSPSATAPTA
uniref:S1 family peptidase n=1 Tax=Pseudonocardia lacus TaxID=2835865 RepID=UPI001BDBF9AE